MISAKSLIKNPLLMMFREPVTIGPTDFISMELNTEELSLRILGEPQNNVNHFNHFFYCIPWEEVQVLDSEVTF